MVFELILRCWSCKQLEFSTCYISSLLKVWLVHWQTYFMVGSGKNMLPSVCVTPELLAVRWLLLVLLSCSCQRRSLYPPSDLYHTVDITTGACPCALQPQSQRKAGDQSYNWREMSVHSGNVKIWMVCLPWVCARVSDIKAIFFVVFCSFTVQQFFMSLARLVLHSGGKAVKFFTISPILVMHFLQQLLIHCHACSGSSPCWYHISS